MVPTVHGTVNLTPVKPSCARHARTIYDTGQSEGHRPMSSGRAPLRARTSLRGRLDDDRSASIGLEPFGLGDRVADAVDPELKQLIEDVEQRRSMFAVA